MYTFSKQVIERSDKDNVILCNMCTAEIVHLTKECRQLIQSFIDSKQMVEQYISVFVNKQEHAYIEKLLNGLIERGILILENADVSREDITIYWDITNECNLNCIHCCADASYVEKVKPMKDIRSIVKKIISINPINIVISGGEPLICPDFYNIIEEIRSLYVNHLSMMTNGTLIDDAKANFISKKFDSISVSLDGFDDESCSILRGKGTFNLALNGIKKLKEYGMRSISASFLLTERTYKQKERFTQLCNSLDISPMFRGLTVAGRAKEHLSDLMIKKDINDYRNFKDIDIEEMVIEAYESRYLMNRTCGATFSQFQIDDKGDLYPCQLMKEERFCLGNILKISNIKDYINKRKFVYTDGYRRFSEYLPQNLEGCEKCPVNIFCHSCPAEAFLRETDNYRLQDCELKLRVYQQKFYM